MQLLYSTLVQITQKLRKEVYKRFIETKIFSSFLFSLLRRFETMVRLPGHINISIDHVITSEAPVTEITESVGGAIFKYLKNHKHKIAQIDAKTGQKDTFEIVLQRCVRTALHMRDKNITHEDIVTICTKNHLNSVVPYIAAQFLGAVVSPIDPSFSPSEMTHLLKQIRPKILFVSSESVQVIEKVLQDICLNSKIIVFDSSLEHIEFSEFLKPHKHEKEFQPVKVENLKDTAVIYFSSGTTGMPKGICLSHRSFLGQVFNFTHTENPDYEYMKLQAERISYPLTFLGYTSLYWVSAGIILLSSIVEGYCRLMCEDFDGKEIWDFIEKYNPIALMLTPIQAIEMMENRRSDVDVRSILSVIIVGSSISKEYSLKLQKAFPGADLCRPYGQTEVCGSLTNFRGNDLLHRLLLKRQEKIESVGLPVRGISYKVVDPDTNQNLGPNQKGELRIKSEFVMNGYYKKDSSDSFDDDGWLKTGDIVYYDEDFCFFVVDRIREAFKYRGWFIAPTMVENELLNHPAVSQAVVIGIPKEDGCHPMGLVVVKDGFHVSEEAVEKFVEERVLERQKLRAGVRFVKSIPLTVTGKVKRKQIREMVLKERLIHHG